jgi:hypothetical protein
MEDASFTRSFDLCTLILAMHRDASLDGGAIELASRLGKPGQLGRTNTGAETNEREKRSSPLTTARKRSVVRKKRKEIKVSVPARTRRVQIRFGCPHVDIVKLQKSIGGISVPNKLGKRAPKRAVRVE